jgi:hypothetical protein
MTVARLVHEALFYRDAEDYAAGTLPFIEAGLANGEPVLVAVPAQNVELVRDQLGGRCGRVRFVDMAHAGRNPGRIIPAVLLAFTAEHAPARVRIVGEPIWPGRTPTEYPPCVQHEARINVTLGEKAATILCPYDASRLHPAVIADAERTHPVLVSRERRRPSGLYGDPEQVIASFNRPFPEPASPATTTVFDETELPRLRELTVSAAFLAGLPTDRVSEFELAVNEAAAHLLRRSPGAAAMRMWCEARCLVCEIRDAGTPAERLAEPWATEMAGNRPDDLVLVHKLCDLVQTYTHAAGTTIRLHVRTS